MHVSDETLRIILSIVLVLLTGTIIPWVRAKMGVENARKWTMWAQQTVYAIEQQAVALGWDSSKKYEMATAALIKLGVPADKTQILIESAVAVLTACGNELTASADGTYSVVVADSGDDSAGK